MPNKTPPEYVIVPREATDAIADAMNVERHKPLSDLWDVYAAALSAAPPHNLIAVDKGELVKTISRLKGVVDGNPMTALWLNPIIHDISKIYVTALQAAVKAAGGGK